jgi:membrane protease YdiL (CAAX protease family)
MEESPGPLERASAIGPPGFWARYGEGVWITAVALGIIALNLVMSRGGVWGLLFRVVTNLVVPMALLQRFARRPVREYGSDFTDLRAQVVWTVYAFVLLAPVVVWFATRVEFQRHYLFTGSGSEFIYKELFEYGVRYFAWEYLLRAFLLFGLARQFGWWAVLLEEVIIFPLAHIGKPTLEIVVSAYAGLVFSVAAYRSKSFLPAFMSHWALAVTQDVLIFVHFRGWGPILQALGASPAG